MSEKFVKINQDDFERIREIVEENKIRYKLVSDDIEYPNLGSKEIAKIKNDYQLKNSRYYLGSDYLYRENVYFIRQYPEYKQLLNAEQDNPGQSNESVKSGRIGRPTEAKAMQHISMEAVRKKMQIIQDAIATVPEAYRKGVFNHVVYQTAYCDKLYHYANINTWKRWTQKFVYEVAVRRGQREIIEKLRSLE